MLANQNLSSCGLSDSGLLTSYCITKHFLWDGCHHGGTEETGGLYLQYQSDGTTLVSKWFPVGGNVNWCSHYGKQYGGASENLELPYDPAIPHLGIYWDKTVISKDTCTPMFIATPFTIDKIWKQPKHPSKDAHVKMWCICAMEYYLGVKRNNAICSNLDGPRDYQCKWNQKERDKYYMIILMLICILF